MTVPDRPAGAAGVVVECFALRMVDGRLAARHLTTPLLGDPDLCAARAVGLARSAMDGVALLHSTSWRWERRTGALVLTYLCCPDPVPLAAGAVVEPSAVHAAAQDPSRPGDAEVGLAAVLHHGIDHLAWLADHHRSLVQPAVGLAPDLWACIDGAGRHRAGRFPLTRS